MKTIPIDQAGRVVLPKEVRRRLHLRAGDRLEAVLGADSVVLKPVQMQSARLVRSGGRVYRDVPEAHAELADFDEALKRGREERDNRAGGL
jgi:AbrB family looped-hinge helix DNA binding protein